MSRLGAAALALLTPACAVTSWFTSTRSEFVAPEPDYLRARLAMEPALPNGRVDHFAVLIGADTELRHRANISLAYQVLLEQGYPRDHIYILDSEGDNPFFPLTDITTRASIRMLFEHLAVVLEPHDTLFLYVTGHGRTIPPEEDDEAAKAQAPATLVLNPGEELTQAEFAAHLERLKPAAGIAFFDHCYWGPLSSEKLCNFVTITSSENENAKHGDNFPRAFWAAFRDRRGSAGPPTIFDAFRFAMVADRATTLGLNKPRIGHACISPSDITLLGVKTSE